VFLCKTVRVVYNASSLYHPCIESESILLLHYDPNISIEFLSCVTDIRVPNLASLNVIYIFSSTLIDYDYLFLCPY
jgi:hypothetical protein